ncbi:MAG: DUF4883 family protein [Clostridium sp.]
MKNKLIIMFLIVCILSCTGCTSVDKLFNKNKPSANYYTENLVKKLSSEKPKTIKVFFKEFFDELTFPETECTDILSFIYILNDKNFIEKPSDLPDTYKYKVYVEFNDIKYAITIFNEKYISIYSWDGDYVVDYVDMTDIPLQLNLYSICKFFTDDN